MQVQKICAARECDELALPGRAHCEEHGADRSKREADRKAAAKTSAIARQGSALYHSSWWRKARLVFLREHPLCLSCAELGLVVAATDVDHIMPHRGDLAKFRDRSNWQALCHACHSRKTAAEVLNARR
ncbi:HNH endonuclease [Thioclava sp. BHET1]|nr:HNH endonuclease [Thioclava sp. BHET1]